MKKPIFDWDLTICKIDGKNASVRLMNTDYNVDHNTACIAHCLLLLIDAINNQERYEHKSFQ